MGRIKNILCSKNYFAYGRSSPSDTEENREMFKKNDLHKKIKIEKELLKIPINERNELRVYMQCEHSDYVEQLINIKIIKKYEKICEPDKKFEFVNKYNLQFYGILDDLLIYFYQKCDICKNLTNIISETNITCDSCIKKKKQNDFNKKWQASSPFEKLNFYSKEKLIILAKRKKIKYSSLTKDELINKLSQNISHDDFPIK